MTVNEYRAQCSDGAVFEFLAGALEIWQNDACIGYAIEAARQIGLTQKQTRDLALAITDRMDITSIDEAAALYRSGKF